MSSGIIPKIGASSISFTDSGLISILSFLTLVTITPNIVFFICSASFIVLRASVIAGISAFVMTIISSARFIAAIDSSPNPAELSTIIYSESV